MLDKKREAIRAYTDAGFALIPLRGKAPVDAKWQNTPAGKYGENNLPENYGIILRNCDLVIDYDPRNARSGDEPLRRLARLTSPMGKAYVVATGGGGLHVYLKIPAGWKIVGKLTDFPGLDFKSAVGQVVGPGSIHPTTKNFYEVRLGSPGAGLPASQALLDLLKAPSSSPIMYGTGEYMDDMPTQRRYVDYLARNAPTSGSFIVACKGRDYGLPPARTLELMLSTWNARRAAGPRTEEELQLRVAHAYKYAKGALGALHPSASFVAVPGANASDSESNRELPVIRTDDRALARETASAWSAVQAANVPAQYFRYGGLPVRIEPNDDGNPIIRELNQDRLRHTLDRVASFCRLSSKEKIVSAFPPIEVVKDMLATPDMPLPVLTRIVEAPVFAPDGQIQTAPGYHPGSKTFYAPAAGFSVPAVSPNPSLADIEKAKALIEELISEFPFEGAADKAHAVALQLLSSARELISGHTPLHLFDAPSPGSGKGLAVDVSTMPAVGRAVSTMTEAENEDEWRKRITAKLITGPSVILIDNIGNPLDSPALASAITSTAWEDRLLGASKMVSLPVRCIWTATGNNVSLSSEMSRRTIRIRLDPKQDRPWLRKGFRHPDLRAWAREHRGELVWAALTLTQGWLAAGRPPFKGDSLGSFESWSTVIGGILQFSGINGFLGNLQKLYEDSDAEGAIWRGFVADWWKRFQGNDVGTLELFEVAAALDLGNGSEKSQKTRLGQELVKMRDRQFDSLRVVSVGERHGAKRWKLVPPEDGVVNL